jgi:hypothetical protein
MNDEIKTLFESLLSSSDEVRYPAFQKVYALTEAKVDWVYEVWWQLLDMLKSENSYQRSIALRLLCNLSQSDSENRIAALLPEILAHTKDEKFITSRQTLQEVWKIAWFRPQLSAAVVEHLKKRFMECGEEKHANLLRQDALQSLLTLAELTHDEALGADVEQLIASEPDEKNRNAFRKLMKG